MKILKIGLLILIFLAGVSSGYLLLQIKPRSEFKIPVVKETARPLDKYTIENLSKRKPAGGEVKIEKTLEENKDFVSYLFSFTTEGKKVTGQMNVPVLSLKYPLILMIRGYVDQKIYQTGVGTKRPAEVFAKNGFITIAPDFLGYGDSNKEASDIFETRFQTYTTVLDLIESIKQPHFAEVNDPEAQTRRATAGKGKDWPKIEVGVTVGGSLTQIKELMQAINNLGRVMVVKEATWATGTPFLQKEGVAITVSLRGEVYFTKEADAG